LKIELSKEELFVIQQSIQEITIKGKDAEQVGKLLSKIIKAVEKAI
tara:strand:+ start:626 stop:763 length:138 start_codon:yes stop_codon:yes gene_type:complete